MSDTSKPPGKISAWVQTHKPEAGAAGGGLLLVAFAIYRRRAAAAAGDTSSAADASTDPGQTAGIVSPDTSADDEANSYQDGLDQLQSAIDTALANPTAPAAPKAPGRSLSSTFGTDIRKTGDTLDKIAMRVYGSDAPWAIAELKAANPDLRSFDPKSLLNLFAGFAVKVPKAAPGRYKPDANKVPPAKKIRARQPGDKNGGTPVKKISHTLPKKKKP